MALLYSFSVNSKNKAPNINGYPIENYTYVYGKPQPIKQWRKQYDTSNCGTIIETFKQDTCNGVKIENRCIGGTNNVKYLGTTNLKKNYYNSTKQYLQSRQKTYNQNQILGTNIKENTYNSIYDSSSCIIYKPSNLSYKTQGSVSSSLNTLKKRNIEITKNSNSFRNPYGLSGSNFGQYHGTAPYFLKNKINNCNDCNYIGYVKPIVPV